MATVLLAAAFKLQLFRYFLGISIAQEIPRSAIIFAGGVFAFVIVCFLLSITMDSVLLVRRAVFRLCGLKNTLRMRDGLRVGVVCVCAVLMTVYGLIQAVHIPDVRRIEIAVPNLPPGLNGLRIVQISDTHITNLFDAHWTEGMVTRINALKPDLVLITGDIIDGSPAERAKDVAPLSRLQARYGVFACLGNHEYYSGLEDWLVALRALGMRVLANDHVALHINGEIVLLGGVTDPTGAERFGLENPDVARTFAGSGAGLRLLMSHQPSVVALAATQGVAVQFSGHTHGGQLFPFSLLVALFNQGFLAGLYQRGDTQLYVSRGAGLWGGFPLRIGAPSEITEIVLRH